jgi:hypothetical protein
LNTKLLLSEKIMKAHFLAVLLLAGALSSSVFAADGSAVTKSSQTLAAIVVLASTRSHAAPHGDVDSVVPRISAARPRTPRQAAFAVILSRQ